MNIELYPLDRAVIDGVSVSLGMTRTAVEAAIGPGQRIENRCYYYNSNMAVHYGADQTVEFIEFSGGPDSPLRPSIYGVSVFDASAGELVRLLTRHNNGAVDDTEQGYCLVFPLISVGVYREIRPEDVEEMIAEMKRDGIPTDGNPDLEQDIRRANHWASIGIGVAGYYSQQT